MNILCEITQKSFRGMINTGGIQSSGKSAVTGFSNQVNQTLCVLALAGLVIFQFPAFFLGDVCCHADGADSIPALIYTAVCPAICPLSLIYGRDSAEKHNRVTEGGGVQSEPLHLTFCCSKGTGPLQERAWLEYWSSCRTSEHVERIFFPLSPNVN